jgi:tetratricopeptide (TPR) repeat protein
MRKFFTFSNLTSVIGRISGALLIPALVFIPALSAQPPQQPTNSKPEAHADTANGPLVQAIASYQKAIEGSPRNVNLRIELGLLLARAGRLTEAIASYDQALQIAPRSLRAELGLAQAYRGVHNYSEAQRILERACREHPKSAAPLSVLGDLDLELETYDPAIKHLTAAIALAPGDVGARDRLAGAYKSKGDEAKALEEVEKALARDPKDALAYFLRGQILFDRNEDEAALRDARKAIEIQPQNRESQMLLAKILLKIPQNAAPDETKQRCANAASVLEPLAEAPTKNSEVLFLLSRAYRCAGERDLAQKTVPDLEAALKGEQALRENRMQAKHLVEQAKNLAMKNDFPGALDLLQEAQARDPSYSFTYSQLAKIYYSVGELEKSSKAISQAIERDPYQPDSLYVQGKILERQEKPDEAMAVFKKVVVINPRESDAYFEIGAICQQRNDRACALAAYKKAAELSPDDPDYKKALEAFSKSSPPR